MNAVTAPPRVLALHERVADDASPDARDTLDQVAAVAGALERLGYEVWTLAVDLDMEAARRALAHIRPRLVFNLVESLGGRDSLLSWAPSLMETMGVPFTGSPAEALGATSHKTLAKRILRAFDAPTPDWLTPGDLERGEAPDPTARYIIKSVSEHASFGMDASSVVGPGVGRETLRREFERRRSETGSRFFAERYIEGREFNLSLLAARSDVEVLPPAEIRFEGYAPDRPRIVDYRAKWDAGSFEYVHTTRRFDFPEADAALLKRLGRLSRVAWRAFGMAGYARVDFRVDEAGRPWILEVNANPCLAPDAGFAAAAERTGLGFDRVIARIVEDCEGAETRARDADRANRAASAPQATARTATETSGGAGFREEARAADLAAVRDLVAATGFFRPEEADIAVELVQARLDTGDASGYRFLFADDGDGLAGYACYGPTAGAHGTYDLYWIAVAPSRQGAGLGRRLIEEVERRVAGEGGRRLQLETSGQALYSPTRGFYERCGFRIEAVQKDYYAPGDDNLVYVKFLDAPARTRPPGKRD